MSDADLLTQSESLGRSGSFVMHGPDGPVQISAGLIALLGGKADTTTYAGIADVPWIAPEDRARIAALWCEATVGEPFDVRHALQCADGRQLQVLQRAVLRPPATPGGHGIGVAIVHDITLQRAAVQLPAPLGNSDTLPTRRIGIAGLSSECGSAAELLGSAQRARQGTTDADGIAFFAPESNAQTRRELHLDAALRQALQRDELSLLYQPQVSLETGAIIGVEALLRWDCAEFGAVSPDEFIPIAERSELIATIGDWVIRQACLQSQRWRQAGLPAIRVGVNVSPVQFQIGDVAATIQRALMDTGVDPGSLGVEVTERAFMKDSERVAATLQTLKDSGIEIALDDFGTGFSSLSRLRRLPIDVIKVDRSFVSDITATAESASITRSIISLAHGLKIRVLAEGVETESQVNMLVANGCDQFQGYFFSKAVTADAIAAMLQESRRLPENLTHRKKRTRTLLLVDDEENILSALKRLFRRDGYTILTARSGAEGLKILACSQVDVILSDQRMPGMSGVEFLRQAKILCPDTIRMTLSGFTELQSIIDAVNEGAVYKFLTKPWDDELLREHVAQAFQQKELADENRRLGHEITSANNNLAELNRRLELSLERQRQTATLMQASAGGARDMVDVLPAAVFGIDPEGMLAYLNPCAAELIPDAMVSLGCEQAPGLQSILATLRAAGGAARGGGIPLTIKHRPYLGWLRRLPESDPIRGEVLVVVPCFEASTS